jgi:hypothetical protein
MGKPLPADARFSKLLGWVVTPKAIGADSLRF